MRRLWSIALAAAVCGWSQPPPDTAEFRAAKQAVEAWMGCSLSLYEDRAQLPKGAVRAWPKEPQISGETVRLATQHLQSFQTSQELAAFLAHGAAHVRIGHSERLASLSKALGILGADRAGRVLQAETMAKLEEEAKPVAAELLGTAGCDPGPCPMFDTLRKLP